MFDVASHRGSVDRPAGGFPLRSILSRVALGCVLLYGLLWLPPVQAGTLYHCTGTSGEAVFSSSTAGYRGCTKISTYGTAAPRHKTPSLPVSLTGITGSVATTAHDLAIAGVEPSSLAGVQGSVETSARRLDATPMPRVSLAAVQGSVETGAANSAGIWASPSKMEARKLGLAASSATASVSATAPSIRRTYYYKIVHADGSLYFGDHALEVQKGDRLTRDFVEYIQTCVACDLHSTIDWRTVPLHLTEYADVIRAASAQYGVGEAFLRAIIHAESAFNPHAMSAKGAQGLMQLMPGTASDMGVPDTFNADENIQGGARYLGLLLKTFNGDERLAAAAYNAGPAAVQRYNNDVPPYAETEVYVKRVSELRKRYDAMIHPPLMTARGPG